ncbi:MAG TPA: hypothetical protein VIW73_01510, partial [Candidatus Cybelea sp.]
TNAPMVPKPPGTIVQNAFVYFNGVAPNAQWRAVASKQHLGASNGRQFYQWYLSFYGSRQQAYRLRYQSPTSGGPLARVVKGSGTDMWFPVQELRIVGAAWLTPEHAQQLVVQSHEMAADCGSATVAVYAGGPGASVIPTVSVANPCELTATIAPDKESVILRGPYYGPKAPLCCPTKTNASAVLRYRNGQWTESPDYFKRYVGRLPPE